MEATMAIVPHRMSSSIKKYFVEGEAHAGIQKTSPLRPLQLPCSITFESEGNMTEDIAVIAVERRKGWSSTVKGRQAIEQTSRYM